MAEITAALVKELREISGAGMMDCKKALSENGGDIEQASDWLRTKGLAAAAKKAGRVAAEGLIGVMAEGTTGALVELNSETDFVARNEQFRHWSPSTPGAGERYRGPGRKATGQSQSIAEKLTQLVAKIGENMNLRRMARISVRDGIVASYMHNQAAPGLGKIGVLVGLESTGNRDKLAALGKQIAMHVAAANPQALTIGEVDPRALERERAVLTEQASGSGKPAEIVAKMVEGRLRKYYEDVVLMEQLYVIDGESRVKQVLEKAAKEIGAPVKIAAFVRMALGEGIEREQKDFAAEVAAQLGG
jgi:elongation factor Ts